jgi:hypothetical protein
LRLCIEDGNRIGLAGNGVSGLKSGGSIEEDMRVAPKVTTFSLRLPLSLKAAVEKLAEADGTSMNQFPVMAAEKLTAMRTAAAFFAERKGYGDRDAAIRFLTRAGGDPPRLAMSWRPQEPRMGRGRRGGRRCAGGQLRNIRIRKPHRKPAGIHP